MKKIFNGKQSRFEVIALLLSVSVLFLGCASMGDQYINASFPNESTIYLKPGVFDVYGGDDLSGWAQIDPGWKTMIIEEMTLKGYSFTDKRNNAGLEIVLREGNTRDEEIVGMRVVSMGFRIQIIDVKSEKVILNKWSQKPVNFGGRYVGDKSVFEFLKNFNHTALLDLPVRKL